MEKVKRYRVWTIDLEADFVIHGLKMDQMLNFGSLVASACSNAQIDTQHPSAFKASLTITMLLRV